MNNLLHCAEEQGGSKVEVYNSTMANNNTMAAAVDDT